jgi:hypothetical protein
MKKYQVFVSSTFEDLRDERQAAVEAVLKSGHIPAGMELFTAGSQSQMDVIRSWIQGSDIFMLILGARYGSIEPQSGLSYVEQEFNYARELGKPFFSVVLDETAVEPRVRERGPSVLERSHQAEYERFRRVVTSQSCAFFSSPKDVKLSVFETLPQICAASELVGWVPATSIGAPRHVTSELAKLSEENRRLKSENEALQKRIAAPKGVTSNYQQLNRLLQAVQVELPVEIFPQMSRRSSNLLDLLLWCGDPLAGSVSSNLSAGPSEQFLFQLATRLASYGLVEQTRVPPNANWRRLKLSKEGIEYLNWMRLQILDKKVTKKRSTAARASKPLNAVAQGSASSQAARVRKQPDRRTV